MTIQSNMKKMIMDIAEELRKETSFIENVNWESKTIEIPNEEKCCMEYAQTGEFIVTIKYRMKKLK